METSRPAKAKNSTVGTCLGQPQVGVPLIIRRNDGKFVWTSLVDKVVPTTDGVFARTNNHWYFVNDTLSASRL